MKKIKNLSRELFNVSRDSKKDFDEVGRAAMDFASQKLKTVKVLENLRKLFKNES